MPSIFRITYQKYISGLILAVSLAFILFLQFHHLGELPVVQWDESRLAVNAAEMYQSGNYLVCTYEGKPDFYNTKPPMMIWLQVGSIYVFGLNEFAIRFPSALSGFLCILLCGYIVYQHHKNTYLSCFSMLLLACSKGFIELHGSMTGDYDALLSLFILAAVHQYYKSFIIQQNPASKKLFLLFLSLAVMCKSAAAFIVFPVLIITLFPQKNFKKIMSASLYCLLSTLPFLIFCFFRELASARYMENIWLNDFGGRFFKVIEGHSSEWYYYIVNLFDYRFNYFIWLLPAALVFSFFSKEIHYRFYSLVLISYLFFLSIPKTRIHWYDMPVLPIVAIVISLLTVELYRYLHKSLLKITYICCFCLLMINPLIEKYKFIAEREGLKLDMRHYGLSNMLRLKRGNEEMKYISYNYDAEYYFYTKTGTHISRGKLDALKPGEIVAIPDHFRDSIKMRYTYLLLDSNQDAQKILISGNK